MRIDVECIPCFARQALLTVRRATDDDAVQLRVMKEVGRLVADISPEMCPPELAEQIYGIISSMTGNEDPYVADKKSANDLVLGLEPEFQEVLNKSEDALLECVKLAISGNYIDLGLTSDYGDIGVKAREVLAAGLGVDDYAQFRETLTKAAHVLVIGDNTGEIVFDRMLIERMSKVSDCRFTYMVRGRPVINDVTIEDAVTVGIDRLAAVADTGDGAPGLVLSRCSEEARRLFMSADMVISKGQGNYEALSDAPRDIFFLLLSKCDAVSRELDTTLGAAVLKHHVAMQTSLPSSLDAGACS